jgi:hypothetical protein
MGEIIQYFTSVNLSLPSETDKIGVHLNKKRLPPPLRNPNFITVFKISTNFLSAAKVNPVQNLKRFLSDRTTHYCNQLNYGFICSFYF